MVLNDLGKIAEQCWKEFPDHFPYASLDEFIVMPNHVHGIIALTDDNPIPVETPNLGVSCVNPHATDPGVSGINFRTTNKETPNLGVSTTTTSNHPPTKRATIGTIINQFKRICTITIRKQNPDFAWQSRFYDHIVRNDDEFNRIREYVLYNPQNWQKDMYAEEMIEDFRRDTACRVSTIKTTTEHLYSHRQIIP